MKTTVKEYIQQLETNGFAIVHNIIGSEAVNQFCKEFKVVPSLDAVSQRQQSTYGIRNLLNVVPSLRLLADSNAMRSLVEPILGEQAIPIRGIFFDKTPEVNWKVPWHQDVTIAVRKRIDVTGFKAWSVKAGVVHVHPPVSVLRNILTLRLHLDDTSEINGALKVIPGSHKNGQLSPEEIQSWKEKVCAVTCNVPAAGVLVMRPLLLHASSASANPSHRRVIHLEYSSVGLPGELEWYGT